MRSDCIDPYMDRFYTQRAFHRVYEHVKRTSDEKVMVVRSWRCRAQSLLSSARRAQPKEVSSASHSSSLLRLATHSSSLLSSTIHSSSLLSSATYSSSHLSSARRGQLIPRELGQRRSALPPRGQLGFTQLIPAEVGYIQLIPAEFGHTQLIPLRPL